MKKTLLSAALLAAMAAPAIQAEEVSRLTQLYDPEYDETIAFEYALDAVPAALTKMTVETDDLFRFEYTYDDQGQCTRETANQKFEGSWITACALEYTYNPDGTLATRKGFNTPDFGKTLQHDFTTVLVYNEDGRLKEYNDYWFGNLSMPISSDIYTYNADGRPDHIDSYIYIDGARSLSSGTSFVYDAQGRLTDKVEEVLDESTNRLRPAAHTLYVYDADGVLTHINKTSSDLNDVVEKTTYVNTDEPASKVIWPLSTPDMQFDHIVNLRHTTNKLESYKLEVQNDVEPHQLVTHNNWQCTYDTVEIDDNAIETVGAATPQLTAISVKGDLLTFTGAAVPASATVYDLNGRVALKGAVEGRSISISGLAAGTYMVVTSNGNACKFVR